MADQTKEFELSADQPLTEGNEWGRFSPLLFPLMHD